ncbi:MAG: trehalose-6-phosphate synthase [Acidimicrobiales bacterium]
MPPASVDRPIVLASNRGPVSFVRQEDGTVTSKRGAGGLVSGIAPLAAETDVTWLAAAMSDEDRKAASAGVVDLDGLHVRLLDLDAETYRLAYDVVSNEVLWFAHHGLWDLTREPAFDAGWADAWDAYRAVNHAFADAVADAAPDGSVVLVQDYHLCLVASRLRAARPDLACVHFHHTPFAPPVWLGALPEAAARELLEGLAAHRSCGFHSRRWADDFRASASVIADLEPATFASPLASDPADIRAAAATPECDQALRALEERLDGRQLIGRVDRVELSKNLLRGFQAYGELLEAHPEHRERVVFVGHGYESRTGVPGYSAYRERVEHEVRAINDRFGRNGWEPIVLDIADDFPRSVALLRRSDALLVNPIRDGLNLVASEGALVNERDGVLALSPEAGAWERLGEAALRTPPFDVAGTAAVLHQALTMGADERRERASRLRAIAEARTPAHWLDDQLAAARS